MSLSGTCLTTARSSPKVVDMNQSETLAAVALTGLLMLLVLVLNELRLMGKRPSRMYPWPETGHVALLEQDEYEFEYYTRDRDQWDAQAYALYMEDV